MSGFCGMSVYSEGVNVLGICQYVGDKSVCCGGDVWLESCQCVGKVSACWIGLNVFGTYDCWKISVC